jgi:hypothetical protein
MAWRARRLADLRQQPLGIKASVARCRVGTSAGVWSAPDTQTFRRLVHDHLLRSGLTAIARRIASAACANMPSCDDGAVRPGTFAALGLGGMSISGHIDFDAVPTRCPRR